MKQMKEEALYKTTTLRKFTGLSLAHVSLAGRCRAQRGHSSPGYGPSTRSPHLKNGFGDGELPRDATTEQSSVVQMVEQAVT